MTCRSRRSNSSSITVGLPAGTSRTVRTSVSSRPYWLTRQTHIIGSGLPPVPTAEAQTRTRYRPSAGAGGGGTRDVIRIAEVEDERIAVQPRRFAEQLLVELAASR